MQSYGDLQKIWDKTPSSYCSIQRAYNIDEACCLEAELDLKLKLKANLGWFYALSLLTLNVYRVEGILDRLNHGLIEEILRHHCYRYKAKVVLERDSSIHIAQTMEYIKLRSKLRYELRGLLHRSRPST